MKQNIAATFGTSIRRANRRGTCWLLGAAAASALAAATNSVQAADLFWDANGNTSAATGGAGNWLTPNTWRSLTSTGALGSWVDNNTANFGGTAGSVTVSGLITADSLKFLTSGYTIAPDGASPQVLTLSGTPTIALSSGTGTGGFNATINNALSAANTVTFDKGLSSGSHEVSLGAANSFSGGLIVNTVRLNVNVAGALGSGAVTLNSTGATAATISSTAAGSTLNSGLIDLSNSFVITGSFGAFGAAGANTGVTALKISGNITSTGGAGDVVITATGTNANNNGNGLTIFSGNNTYAGRTVIAQDARGALRLESATALPTNTALVFGRQTNTPTGHLDLNGNSITISSLSSSEAGTGASGNIVNTNGSSAAAINITGSATTTFGGIIGTFATSATNGTALSAAGLTQNTNLSLTLDSAHTGSLRLTNVSNYTGDTTVNGGTLVVAHTATTGNTLAGNVIVNNASTLASAGGSITTNSRIGGAVTASNTAQVTPGGTGGIGTLTINNGLTLNDSADLNFDFASLVNFDNIALGGSALTLNGTHDINIGTNLINPGTYTLATYGSLGGAGSFVLGTNPGGTGTYTITAGTSALTLDVIPGAPLLVWDIGGAGAPIVEGAGTWSDGSTDFTDLSTNTGATFANAGNLTVQFGNGGTATTGGTITLGSPIRVGGELVFGVVSPTSPYIIGDGSTTNTLTLAGGITANSNAGINAPVELETSQTWKAVNGVTLGVGGAIADGAGGPKTITKTGGGVLALAGNNTFSGGLVINEGTADANSDAAMGAGPITLDNNATFRFGGAYSTDNNFTVNAAGGRVNAVATFDSTITGVISGSGALTKTGNGLLTLTSNNPFASLTVDGGAVAFANEASLGTGDITLSGGGLVILNDYTLTKNLALINGGSNNRLDTQGFTLTHAGSITGVGDLLKNGTGTLVLNNDNSTRTGLTIFSDTLYNGNPSADAGTIRTGHLNALGSGNVQIFAPGTLDTTVSLSVGAMRGDATLVKTGPGTLTVSGSTTSANGGATLVVDQGSVIMNSRDGLGGLNPTTNIGQAQMNIVLNSGTELITNWSAGTDRRGGNITLNSATLTRPAGGAANETGFVAYNGTTNFNNVLTVSGNSTIRNQEIAGTGNHILSFEMPVVVQSGATLTLHNDNNNGADSSFLVAFRGTNINNHPNDAFTIESGATVQTTGPGQIRWGRTASQGKVIVAKGTSAANDSVLKLHDNAYLSDIPGTNNTHTRFAVQGSGDGGLRIEAAMNATYTNRDVDTTALHDGFTGLFGVNTTSTMEGGTPPAGFNTIGNAHTILSPRRLNTLSDPFNATNPSGTLTVAANDAAGATGVISTGPNAATDLKLALDNTATSGNLVYEIQPSGDGGKFANFGGLAVKRTNTGAGSVTARVNADGTATGVLRVNTLSVDATAGLDLTDNDLIVQNSPFTDIQNMVLAGFGTTTQIHSSTSDGSQILALFDNAQVGATDWLGHTLAANAVVGKYTYFGDVNIDGQVSGDDYTVVDANLNTTPAVGLGWLSGDANLDGIVTGDDYTVIDANLGLGNGNPLTPSSLTAVPEPALGLLVAAAGLLPGRRRRHTRQKREDRRS